MSDDLGIMRHDPEWKPMVEDRVVSWLRARGWQTSIEIGVDFYRDDVRDALQRLERRGLVRKRPTNKFRAHWEWGLTEEGS